MDPNILLSSVNNINDYILATEQVQKCDNINVPLTMSIIINLKKNISLEIEFFNKCEGHGIAFHVFEQLLKQPPSQTWHLLGKELVPMVQYWLEAVRRHLISHNPRWWSFLVTLLRFIQEIKLKHSTLTNIIVEQTVECLLEIACNNKLDEIQRDRVLRLVNLCSADSSREIRLKHVRRLNGYFVTLATILSNCGHYPTQTSIMEVLVRWLVGRHDPAVRSSAVAAWFPKQLFSEETIQIFLKSSWREFYKDSRRFLNCHNKGRDPHTVVSSLCGEVTVGRFNFFIANSTDDCIWMDLNYATKSITIYLDLREVGEGGGNRLDMLTVTDDNTLSMELKREHGHVMLLVQTQSPLQLTFTTMSCMGDACNLRVRVAGAPRPLGAALGDLFPDKYRGFTESSQLEKPTSATGGSVPRRYRSGYAVRSRLPLPWSSPSSTSTTSLAQLRDKLTALSPLQYSKVTEKISITPDLPVVKEVTEYEDFGNSLSKPRRCGAAVKYLSDSEVKSRPKNKIRSISPVNKDPCPSLLLVATLGTSDESIVNDTFNKIYTSNTEVDLLDLLVEEALQNEGDKDSGIISGKRTQDTEVIENTPIENKNVRPKKLTLKSRAKSVDGVNTKVDESDTDVIEDTPCYVYDRRKTVQKSKNVANTVNCDEIIAIDDDKFEAVYSEHRTEHKSGSPVVSPTFDKKIIEIYSDASDILADNIFDSDGIDYIDLEFQKDIVDCLDNIIDKVCNIDIDVFPVLIDEQQHQIDSLKTVQCCNKSYNVTSDSARTNDALLLKDNITNASQDSKKITLKFKQTKPRTRGAKMNAKSKNPKIDKKLSQIDMDKILVENITSSPVNTKEAVLIRKKRKLYSPKDDDNDNEMPRTKIEARQSNICKTPIATCYRELEKARRNQPTLSRKTRASTEPLTSPKTKRLNDMFDQIKEDVVNSEEITFVKRLRNKKEFAVYNLSSESDDGDFKKKKVPVQKRVSSSSLESSVTKRARTLKKTPSVSCEYNSSLKSEIKNAKKSKIKQTKPRSRKIKIPITNLIDEKMRASAPEVLETSFVRQTDDQRADDLDEPVPALKEAPVIEAIHEDVNYIEPNIISTEIKALTPRQHQIKIKKEKGPKNIQNTKSLAAKKSKTLNVKRNIKVVSKEKDSTTVSPLPGLVVETEQSRKDDLSSSLEANLLQKFKNIYTEVQDLNDTNCTQSMLIGEDNLNYDATIGPNENLRTILDSDIRSEKSIATDGTSPITAHNDLHESPPNVKSLEETIQHRNLDIQDLSGPLAEFLVDMRNQLISSEVPNTVPENKTSPVLPITRISTRERAMSVKSNASIPKVTLNMLTSDEIDTPKSDVCTPLNKRTGKVDPDPVTPRSSARSAKVVLSKMSSEEIQKYLSPVNTPNSSSSKSVSVGLKRISTDEINRWLPIPQSKEIIEENPKKYNTRQTSKSTSVSKHAPSKVVKKERISNISPVKLSFEISEMTQTRAKRSLRLYKTRSSTKSIKSVKSRAINIDKDIDGVIIDSQKTSDENTSEKSGIRDDVKLSNQESAPKSCADKLRKEKIPVHSAEASDVNSEINKSVASVKEWFDKNARSPTTDDNTVLKEVMRKVLQTLETTLAEIHQSTGQKLTRAFLEHQKDMISIKDKIKEDADKMLRRIEELEEKQKKLACEVIRDDMEKKVVMVTMLKEDVQDILDFVDKQNK